MPTISFSWPDRSYYYTLLVVSLLTAKFVHLFSHLPAVPIFLFLLYFPTFIFPDVFVLLFSRIIFQKWPFIGFLLCLLITTASAAQLGFFLETGGEIRWHMLAKVLREPEGFFGMLMSGFAGVAAITGVLAGVSWLFNPWIYNTVLRVVKAIICTLSPSRSRQYCSFDETSGRPSYAVLRDSEEAHSDDEDDVPEIDEKKSECAATRSIRWARLKLLVVTVVLVVLHIVRPRSPFTHMSGTLPFTLFEGIFSKRSEFCDPAPWDGPDEFPLRRLLKKDFWIPPVGQEGGIGRGWTPGRPWWEVELERKRPEWLPTDKAPDGFAKWYRKPHALKHHKRPHHKEHNMQHDDPASPREMPPSGYEPVLDPLKISNLDQPLLSALKEMLAKGGKVPIKHVVLLSLESTRKDVFPLIKDGPLYKQLIESREEEDSEDLADLSSLSRTAELLTGQKTPFERSIQDTPSALNGSFGGININGAVTGSTFTLKSLLGSHCGVNPLAVDFLEELETEIYQPCLPQILSLFNMQQSTINSSQDEWGWSNATWKSVFMQASTNKFDRQQPALEQMGFKNTLVREDLMKSDAKYPPKEPELNYFGYSETELKPYIKELFETAEKDGQRVFLSHLTSSTHHPWATPEDFGKQQRYWGGSKGGDTAWDRYLNSIRWGDNWIGEVMKLLEETGVADKTLVVAVGDHGFSFDSSTSSAKTTYANAHIHSFRIPLTFHHPALPPMQINVTTTPMSIVPTILDLLVSTSSISAPQKKIASFLLPEYEAQSLIRPFIPSVNGRQQWNFGVVNPGGTHLSIISSAKPYRLVMPICEPSAYTFSDLEKDPSEQSIVEDWDGQQKLRLKVKTRYGDDAARWVEEAEKIGSWMVWEGRRRWGYWGGARREDRGAEHNDDGLLEHDHWWDT